jgi:hypothetical protein
MTALFGVDERARRRIALHLLPFAFLLYVVAQLDRVNVSFAILRMKTDLGITADTGIAEYRHWYTVLR